METSSPLAAMRPTPPSNFGQSNMFGPRLVPSPLDRGQFTFQLRNAEYFNLKAVQGSSPAASLAADLSQNFKLNEASPMFPTPRRALFTTATMMDAFEARGHLTTPPLPPSSSPGCVDMMDMSPLPHKAPFIAHTEAPSPTPGANDDDMLDSPALRPSALQPAKPIVSDRRRLGLRRPSLTRAKGFSTSGLLTRSNAENQPPPFRFEAGGDGQLNTSHSAAMSPSECFQDSPLRNGAQRARIYRRSVSMFENSGDAVKPKSGGQPMPPGFALHSVADIEEPPEYVLPHFFSDDPTETIPRITRETMLEVLDGKYNEHFDHKMIIDCRFEYEYEGGHINGAINYNDKELLATQLVDTPIEGRTLLIFHCEYSVHRAPIMARHIRSKDREANVEQYPKLTYPEVYILDGGYSAFFAEHPERCYPQAYVEMNAAEHVNTCERELGRLRQNRKGLGRAQTYAFGQQDPTLLDSPTGPSRLGTRESDLSSMLGSSPIGTDRAYARRMVSF
ncbi:f094a873-3987-410d-ace2-8b2944faecff [Thermothielavioides terrestris]|uniref:M-phase inducer phosphatase n=1 Tax=Thermothielavioides terrestris TaxID=2587410 RepID=A0A3S4ETF4_9PEZI|nr:f094a873-3987-410d-ace2-8b2944faecff [Thermothielavioides terrestris]